MNRNYFNFLMAIAALGLLLIISFMWNESHTHTQTVPSEIISRPVSPFRTYISGVGIVEPSSENIYIGSPLNRVIEKVEVKIGEKIQAGQVLFRLESRDLTADLHTRTIAYENAKANLQKLEALPRKEDVIAAAASLRAQEIGFEQADSQYLRVEGLQNSGAMSSEEVTRRKYASEEAKAHMQQAQADFDKIKAGAWPPELHIARLQVQQAKADVVSAETAIERTVITSPINATVLQMKIHSGEYPPSDSSRTPAMIIGNIDTLHLRVSINQFDASYYDTKAPATAFLQGNADLNFPLQFVGLEPYFVTKQNLTNDITEKVDTRVLQAIYSFKDDKNKVFVGQQMDVFIETQPKSAPQ